MYGGRSMLPRLHASLANILYPASDSKSILSIDSLPPGRSTRKASSTYRQRSISSRCPSMFVANTTSKEAVWSSLNPTSKSYQPGVQDAL